MPKKIKISIQQLETLMKEYKNKLVDNIVSNIGSYDAIQELRRNPDWQQREIKLKEDIETIALRTTLPSDIALLKKYLS